MATGSDRSKRLCYNQGWATGGEVHDGWKKDIQFYV